MNVKVKRALLLIALLATLGVFACDLRGLLLLKHFRELDPVTQTIEFPDFKTTLDNLSRLSNIFFAIFLVSYPLAYYDELKKGVKNWMRWLDELERQVENPE